MSRFQWLMVILCFILNFNDGIDVLLVSFSSTEIIADWGLSKLQMGYIFSAGLAGMTLGALLIAPLADKIGRRKVFLLAVGLIVIGMLGVGFCYNFPLMLLLRLITGLGIGGILPTMAATAAEFSNDKYRDFNVGLVQAGWPIGAILTGLLAAKYIPVYGWHAAFIVAGVIALVMWLLVAFFMTDSLEFILHSDQPNALEEINNLLQKMKMAAVESLPPVHKKAESLGINALFTEVYKFDTLKMWIAAFFGFLTLYTLMSWVPTIAKEEGLPFELATYVGIMLNIGAAVGSASIGAIGSKFGLRQAILTFMITAFALMQVYAFSMLTTSSIFILVFLIGIFVQGGFNGIWPTLSRIYETKIRTTGVGFTVSIGRLGAILGPFLFGYLSDIGVSIKSLFVIFSIPLILMGVFIWRLKSDKLTPSASSLPKESAL
ncbi:MAG: MFS transporter [Spirosomataceae bacterium]